MDEEDLRELPTYRSSDRFTELEKLVLDYATGISRSPVDVPDELFERLRAQLDEAQLVELTSIIALENYRVALQLGVRDRGPGLLRGRVLRPARGAGGRRRERRPLPPGGEPARAGDPVYGRGGDRRAGDLAEAGARGRACAGRARPCGAADAAGASRPRPGSLRPEACSRRRRPSRPPRCARTGPPQRMRAAEAGRPGARRGGRPAAAPTRTKGPRTRPCAFADRGRQQRRERGLPGPRARKGLLHHRGRLAARRLRLLGDRGHVGRPHARLDGGALRRRLGVRRRLRHATGRSSRAIATASEPFGDLAARTALDHRGLGRGRRHRARTSGQRAWRATATGTGSRTSIGARQIDFSRRASRAATSAFGYPAEPTLLRARLRRRAPLLGARRRSPVSDNPPGSGPPTLQIDCDMTGGSSGGGWVTGDRRDQRA